MDGEIILHMYPALALKETIQRLDGVFGATLVDLVKRQIHIFRDTFGVKPLFTLTDGSGTLGICSEAKGGLDSSLTAASVVTFPKENGLQYPVQTYSTGMRDSPDLVAAKKLSDGEILMKGSTFPESCSDKEAYYYHQMFDSQFDGHSQWVKKLWSPPAHWT